MSPLTTSIFSRTLSGNDIPITFDFRTSETLVATLKTFAIFTLIYLFSSIYSIVPTVYRGILQLQWKVKENK